MARAGGGVIRGAVNAAYEPIVALAVQGPTGQIRDIEAVVDTGYNGFLTLPPAMVSDLRLPFSSIGRGLLANGDEIRFEVYRGTVQWDGEPRHIRITAADATPLVGMRLLEDHSLLVDVKDGGRVVVQPIEQQGPA